MRRLLLLIAVATIAALASAAPAGATVHTNTFDVPVQMNPYEVKQTMNFVHTPEADGFIVGMSVDVVNPDGSRVPIKRLMLHHIVFAALGRPNPLCKTFTGYDSRPYPANFGAELFYGAGEERNVLALPPGYGYKISANDKAWAMVWMLMNHRGVTDHARIRYTVRWDDSPDLTAVHPYWLDVRNCQADPIFSVPGGQPKGSTYKQTYTAAMPEGGRIVAGGGHVHGGARNLQVTEPDCSNRKVYQSNPAWGMPDHPFYNVRPILHEPGPISMSGMLSQKGYPVAKGERLRLTANYDAHLPHTRVMGISMFYLAPDDSVGKCAPPPDDAVNIQPAALRQQQYRTKPPVFTVPLTGLDKNGNAVTIDRPPGPTYKVPDGATVRVSDNYFGKANLQMAQGSTLNWNFASSGLHNVTLANGPRGFASPNLNDSRKFKFKFTKPGTYRIFCALHPVTMAQTVTVPK